MKIGPVPDSSRTGPRALGRCRPQKVRPEGNGKKPRGNVQQIRDASRIAADVVLRVAGLGIGSLSLAPVSTPPAMKDEIRLLRFGRRLRRGLGSARPIAELIEQAY